MSEGMYPNADATAPGGMSKANLRIELAEKHGLSMDKSRDVSWPDLIDLVIDARQVDERKARETLAEFTCDRCGETGDHWLEDCVDVDVHEDDDVDTFYDFDDADAEAHEAAVELIDALASPLADIAEMAEDDSVIDPEALFAEMQQAREENTPPPVFMGIPGVKDYVFDGHAGAGPSASERWMTCTMSLSASRAFLETLSPNQQAEYAGANTAARQGTTAHAAAETEANLVLGRISQVEADAALMELTIMPEVEDEAYDAEMAEYIIEYVTLIQTYAQERGEDHVMIEGRVEAAIPLDALHEGEVYVIRGSADMIGLPTEDEPELVVADLKYGNGLWVDVDENSQARIYALGALDLLTDDDGNLISNVETVRYYIVQPRMDGIKEWTETLDDLLDWRDEVLTPALTKALYGHDEGATYQPSEKACQFCPARGGCPALTEQRVAQAADLFDVIVDAEFTDGPGAFPETTSITDTRLGELLTQVAGLIDIHKDLKEEAQRRLHRGDSIPGYQLVSYTPPRKWAAGAAEQLGEVPIWKDPTLLTPTQALKVLASDAENLALVEDLVVAPAKRPVIAKVGDRRKTWDGPAPESMFDIEEEA